MNRKQYAMERRHLSHDKKVGTNKVRAEYLESIRVCTEADIVAEIAVMRSRKSVWAGVYGTAYMSYFGSSRLSAWEVQRDEIISAAENKLGPEHLATHKAEALGIEGYDYYEELKTAALKELEQRRSPLWKVLE